jgi:hypothetical protein
MKIISRCPLFLTPSHFSTLGLPHKLNQSSSWILKFRSLSTLLDLQNGHCPWSPPGPAFSPTSLPPIITAIPPITITTDHPEPTPELEPQSQTSPSSTVRKLSHPSKLAALPSQNRAWRRHPRCLERAHRRRLQWANHTTIGPPGVCRHVARQPRAAP